MENGVVIKSTGSWYEVKAENEERILCRVRGQLRIQGIKSTNPVAVGDYVLFSRENEQNTGRIFEILPRRNCIIRKATNLSKQTQIIAANIDQVCLIISLVYPHTSTGFIDRFIVTAEAYQVPVILCFNKIDLYDERVWKLHEDVLRIYREVGYTCIELSALEHTYLERLTEILCGKISLFAGHSGAGKSTLVNAINPILNVRTDEVSDWSLKGKHTTTFAEMLPCLNNGQIIDTPGVKEFGIVDFQKEELSLFYPEMRSLRSSCRYHNCTHDHEPECAVRRAVENGKLSQMRYTNYLQILKSLQR